MKTATLLLIATCLTPLLFSACSTGSGYSNWKSNNPGPSGAANPYGVPRAGGELGSYPQAPTAPTSPENAPYQPLPPIAHAGSPAAPSAAPSLAPSNTLDSPTTASTTYTVVPGDSLWGIARKNGTSVEAIQSANGLSSTTIRIGQQLNIPSN